MADAELSGHLGDRDLDAVVATLRLACGVPIAIVNIVTADRQTFPAESGVGAPGMSVPDELCFCAEVVDTGHELSVSDAAGHAVYAVSPLVLDGGIAAYAGVPLVDNGVVLGTVAMGDSQIREFSGDDLAILRHQAQLASSVLALRRSARTDILTGLPNRALYLDRLERALSRLERHSGQVAVMYLDVDGFKGINDTFGHDVGDRVLIELTRRLTSVMRPTDTLARFGGDEFVAVCEQVTSPSDAALVAARMIAATESLWVVDNHSFHLTVSIGIALADSPSDDPSALLRDADAAMYRAKSLAGAGWDVATSGNKPRHLAS